MSGDTPKLPAAQKPPTAPTPPAAPVPASQAAPEADQAGEPSGRESADLVVALSPRQIIGGFALLAGLILMLRRRSRRKR